LEGESGKILRKLHLRQEIDKKREKNSQIVVMS
jgi:hypothetical protein